MKQTLTDNEFLDGLTNLFLREGITGLTVGEIAARLRCSRRRLYGIALTKEAIFSVMVDRYFRARLQSRCGSSVERSCQRAVRERRGEQRRDQGQLRRLSTSAGGWVVTVD